MTKIPNQPPQRNAGIISEAREFLSASVFRPALASTVLTDDTKNSVRHASTWIPHFERVGDLAAYLDRCISAPHGTKTHEVLARAGLRTYEDIRSEFRTRFTEHLTQRTTLSDFAVGARYSSFQLTIFAERYDNRSGGILPIGTVGQHSAVLVKATLSGGPYPNAWLVPGKRLRYFLKSRKTADPEHPDFNEQFAENRAIVEYPDIPVYVFYREESEGPFTYAGIFLSAGVHREPNGSKWFELVARDESEGVPRAETEYEETLRKRVRTARKISSAKRREILANTPKLPRVVSVVTKVFDRSPHVIAEVLERANGVCECCGQSAPFLRRSDGSPYLEVHHKIPLAEKGEDTVENAIALCPNCHRNEHHGTPKMRPPS